MTQAISHPSVLHPSTIKPPAPQALASDEPAETSVPVGPLLDALSLLGRAASVEIDRSLARKALSQATRDQLFSGEDAWFNELRRAGAMLGLQVRHVRCAPEEIAKLSPGLPLPAVTLVKGGTACLAVLEQRGGRVRVELLSEASEARWVSLPALASQMGAMGAPSQPLWAFADPEHPMAAIALEGDGHGDGHGPGPLRRLASLLRLEREEVSVAVVYAVGVGVTSLAAPIGVQALVNAVAFGGLLQPIVVLTLLVLAALALSGVLRGLQAWVVERIQARVFARVAIDLSRRLPRIRAEAFDQAHGPELINRFFDVLTVQKGAATLLVDGLSVVLQVLVGAVILGLYHPWLLIFDFVLIGVAMLALVGLGRGAVKTSIKESKAKYEVAAWLEEMARHQAAFKSSGGGGYASARAEDLTHGYLSARRAHFRVLFRQIVASLAIQALATAALLGVGGLLVVRGQITLGQLVAAELIVTAMLAAFAKLGKYLENYYDLLAAIDKLGHLVDLPLEPVFGSPLPRRERGARVRMRGLSFGYGPSSPVLEGAHLHITPGQRVAVIGANASGKSTLADLLYGLRAPTGGSVEIDGVDMRDLCLSSLREQIALVRDVEIFEGTIADNIRMGRQEIRTSDIRAALEMVGLWDDIAALPQGLNTKLTTFGTILSAGQARRLVLARAIAGKPRLLILDEALDNIEPSVRGAVARAVMSREAPWSVLMTTHDREALRGCDEVHVLSEGQLRPLRAGDLPST